MDCIVHGVAKSWTRLSYFHFHFQGLRARAPTPKARGLISQQLPVQQAKLASCSTSGARRTLENLASQSGLISPPSHSHTEQEGNREGPNLRCTVACLTSDRGLPATEHFGRSSKTQSGHSSGEETKSKDDQRCFPSTCGSLGIPSFCGNRIAQMEQEPR